MPIDSNRIETDSSDIFRSHFDQESGEILAGGFDEEETETLIRILAEIDDPPTVRLLARQSILKWLRNDFFIASTAAELITADTLSLRTIDEPFANTLLVTDASVVSFVSMDERIAGLVTNDAEFVATAREHWESAWETAEEFSLRTPARSHVEETLAEEFGPDVEADFQTMLTALDTTRGASDEFDEVTISLLVAAKNDELLYDISKWGEDAGVASKATFSREKNRLEESGVIDTEKVSIDIGRPRQRLILGDERLHDADADELASAAQSILSTSPA